MKIAILAIVLILAVSFVSAQPAPGICTSPGVEVDSNPEGTIVICDDPQDSTCEQDFGNLCPTNWHLCSPDEYNAGNDNWQGTLSTWLLGEITCREYSGAGHYTLWDGGTPYSLDVPFNQYAGSSLSECQSDYGCNEQQYYALCCIGEGGDPVGGNDVPEFGLLGATVLVAGLIGFVIWKRK